MDPTSIGLIVTYSVVAILGIYALVGHLRWRYKLHSMPLDERARFLANSNSDTIDSKRHKNLIKYCKSILHQKPDYTFPATGYTRLGVTETVWVANVDGFCFILDSNIDHYLQYVTVENRKGDYRFSKVGLVAELADLGRLLGKAA